MASVLLFAGLMHHPVAAGEDELAPQRISFAVSGGLSLGAYEAGLNWALITITRDLPDIDPLQGGRLRGVRLDSVAGASTGAVNALLSGLAWCQDREAADGLADRLDANIFRDLWLVPDVNDLLPPDARSATYLPGDGVFSRRELVIAADHLRESWNRAVFRPGCRVRLGVTVTRVIPEQLRIEGVTVENQRFVIPFDLMVGSDRRVRFSFNPADYPAGARNRPDVILLPHHRGDDPHALDDERILEAVLTSSAFPVAFGRKRLSYCRSHVADASTAITQEKAGPLYCPEGYELAEAEFSDGGLFDNLPLGLARRLAENPLAVRDDWMRVAYMYLDPARTRFPAPPAQSTSLCDEPEPPPACEQMEFGLESESALLLGALGTARRYELFRELSSDTWALNLSELGHEIAAQLRASGIRLDCRNELPFFDREVDCAEALDRAGHLIDLAYTRVDAPISEPFSPSRLRAAGIAWGCRPAETRGLKGANEQCRIRLVALRARVADAQLRVLERSGLQRPDLVARIRQSELSTLNDRIVRVSTRGSPVTGSLLDAFGAFFDLKFREYDYYIGIYDAVTELATQQCERHFSPEDQAAEYASCFEGYAKAIHDLLDISDSARARYVFALAAKQEFGEQGRLRFAYDPMPAEDGDMAIIHTALLEAQAVAENGEIDIEGRFAVDRRFFESLSAQGFEPTPTADGSPSLLAQILDDPDQWSYEFVRRATERLLVLEQEAERILAERNPKDPSPANVGAISGISYLARTFSYKYPAFAWAPSVAPRDWIWRNVIPYELAIDLVDRDFLITWQPTWGLTNRDNVAIRGTLGLAGGVLSANDQEQEGRTDRGNYVSLGLDYTRNNRRGSFSYGITPTYYYLSDEPDYGSRDSWGADVHIGFLRNRIRLAVGARDVDGASDTWFFTVGFADFPGLIYWTTR